MKNSMIHSIRYAISQIYEGDHKIVWFSFYKNISEAIFNALFNIYVFKYIFECIQNGVEYKKLAFLVTGFCLAQVIIHITSATHAYYQRLSKKKIYRHIFQKVIHKAKRIEITQYENPKFYDEFSRALDEALDQGYEGMLNLTFAFGSIAGSIVSLVILASVDWVLILFAIPPIIGSLYFGMKESKESYNSRVDSTVGKRKMEYAKRVFYEKKYAGELRLYPISNILFGLHRNGYQERADAQWTHQRRIAIYQLIESLLFAGLITLLSYLYITYQLKIEGVNKIAAYVAMITAIAYTVGVIGSIIDYFSKSGKYCMYMKSLEDFIQCKTEEIPSGAIEPSGKMGDLSFQHVYYHYSGSSQMIIKDLSMEIHQGEHVALVGENGAGKTTLMKLLMGLYPISEGIIKSAEHDIQDYTPIAYRDCFGTVFQDFQIFSLPLSENVLMRTPKSEEDRQLIIDSLKKAQFDDVLEKLPSGIDTQLTKEFDENGFVCSGGQAQKIAIARVFAKNPDIIILDEPSSALDPIAEYNMYQNMMKAARGKTVFFISHRMSSARMADRILFLENGSIVEEGTHDELMLLQGRYAAMFSLQAQNYQDEMGGDLYEESI